MWYKKKRLKNSATSNYRSGLEEHIAKQLEDMGVEFEYETLTVRYKKPEQESRYTPDFILPNKIIIESKGAFVTSDRKKHRLIKEQHPELDIRFVFSNPNTRIGKKSKTTYAAWCERYGFQYATKSIPNDWINE